MCNVRKAMLSQPMAGKTEEDPEGKGTTNSPIMFAVGMEVYENYFYTDGNTRYICIKTGIADSLSDTKMFEEF